MSGAARRNRRKAVFAFRSKAFEVIRGNRKHAWAGRSAEARGRVHRPEGARKKSRRDAVNVTMDVWAGLLCAGSGNNDSGYCERT